MRFELEGNPDLSYFTLGQEVDVNNARDGDNNNIHTIYKIDTVKRHLFMSRYGRVDSSFTTTEMNTRATIDYSQYNFGKIFLPLMNGSNTSTPFLYYDPGKKLNLIIGSSEGHNHFFKDILNQPDSFPLYDDHYVGKDFGNYTSIGGADINGDNRTDLAIGNIAGGFSLYFAKSDKDTTEQTPKVYTELTLFPNPGKYEFFLQLPESLINANLRIYDYKGSLIFEEQITSNTYHFRKLISPGLYIVAVEGADEEHHLKWISRP